MATSISTALRTLLRERARNRCEYCLLPQSLALHKHEPDHIVPVQHGGVNDEENLALSCMRCNRFKGPNVGSFDTETGNLVPFFNPRKQQWDDHFQLEDGVIVPLTQEGRVTVRILRLNDEDRVTERRAMIEAGLF
ncbi:MAG: HNH endonuclease [Candidatus Electrothrix sp. AW3_4]|nr:HNH endonuclease [Candidatus Electrothrix gigas]